MRDGHQRELRDEGERVVGARAGGGGPDRVIRPVRRAALAPGSRFAGWTAGPAHRPDPLTRRARGPPDPARRPDRAHPPDRRAPLLLPGPAHRPGHAHPPDRRGPPRTGLAPLTLRARRPRLTRRPGRALQARGPPGAARPALAGSRAPLAGRGLGGRGAGAGRAGPAGRGGGAGAAPAAVPLPAAARRGCRPCRCPFDDPWGPRCPGGGPSLVLLDRAVLRSYLYRTSITSAVSKADTSNDPEAAQAAGEQGDHPGRVPGIRPPMCEGRVCHRVPRKGIAPHAGFRVPLLARAGPPRALLADVQRAEEAGFDAAMCSDHFSPWSSPQGHSGFAWSWLGAALQATDAAVRRGQRARASATTRRSSRRPSPRSARCSRAGSGWRWAAARRATSTSPATAGRARRSATPACASAST